MKVSTMMVLLLRTWSSFRGHLGVSVFRRTIPVKALAEATTTAAVVHGGGDGSGSLAC